MAGSDHGKAAAPAPAVAVAPAPTVTPAAGRPVRLHFETGSAALSSENQKIVAAVAQRMKETPDLKVDVSGFADKTGNAEQNLELARQRATTVRDALKAAGIAEDRMNLKKPEQVILGVGQDAEGRRVEISVAK